MMRYLKIALLILLAVILIDTLQARLLNNSPLIHITSEEVDKGILVDSYVCNGEKKTIFKWESYTCSVNYSEFIRTYTVLYITDSEDDSYVWLTIRSYQSDEVASIRVESELCPDIEIGSSYEFSLKPYEKIAEDSIVTIFNSSNIISITKTNKEGLEQVNESIPE